MRQFCCLLLQVFVNPPELLHITIFHTSRPNDPRPKPLDPTGGCDITQLPHLRKAPLAEDLSKERDIVKSIVGSTSTPCLTVHRALMAETGTLLLTWTDPCGAVSQMRKDLVSSFPGKPTSQAKIIHTSLLRVLSPDAIDKSTISSITSICDDWSARWKNKVFNPRETWFVYEETFSIINGPRVGMPFSENGISGN